MVSFSNPLIFLPAAMEKAPEFYVPPLHTVMMMTCFALPNNQIPISYTSFYTDYLPPHLCPLLPPAIIH